MAFTWKVTRGHLMGTLPEGARAPGLGGPAGSLRGRKPLLSSPRFSHRLSSEISRRARVSPRAGAGRAPLSRISILGPAASGLGAHLSRPPCRPEHLVSQMSPRARGPGTPLAPSCSRGDSPPPAHGVQGEPSGRRTGNSERSSFRRRRAGPRTPPPAPAPRPAPPTPRAQRPAPRPVRPAAG